MLCTGPAQFEKCSGDYIPQVGCSGVEKLPAIVGQSVEFNIALSHQGTVANCFNQSIVMVSIHKNGSTIPVVECSNVSCSISGNPRLSITRSAPYIFSISMSLNNLNKSDSGNYIASADIRIPSNARSVRIFKNFSLAVEGRIPQSHRVNYQSSVMMKIRTRFHASPVMAWGKYCATDMDALLQWIYTLDS